MKLRLSRRSVNKIIVLLAAGVAINVAVAWGCVMWSPTWTLHDNEARAVEFVDRAYLTIQQTTRQANDIERGTAWHTRGFGHRVDAVNIWFERDGLEQGQVFHFWRHQCGWPMTSLYSQCWGEAKSARTQEAFATNAAWSYDPQTGALYFISMKLAGRSVLLPVFPQLPGFAVNTLVYAAVLWMLFCGPFALRRMIHRRRGQCPACAYPIGSSDVCTECGAALKHV